MTEIAKIKVGPHNDWDNFMGPVMYVVLVVLCNLWIKIMILIINNNSGRPSFDKIISYIKKAKDAGDEILIGGSGMFFICIITLCP